MSDAATFFAATPLTTSRVARVLHCSEGTVRNLAQRGDLPHTKTATGTRLFDPDVVERVAAERTARRSSEKPVCSEENVVP
jgi:excisionase family DNA binding protein